MNNLNPYPVTCTEDELIKTNNLIAKEHFKNNINNEELAVVDNNITKSGKDVIICNICGRTYKRYNKSKHCKTKHHIFCVGLNMKWRNVIIK